MRTFIYLLLLISKALCGISCQYVADYFINYNLDLNWFNIKLSESGMCKLFHCGMVLRKKEHWDVACICMYFKLCWAPVVVRGDGIMVHKLLVQ